MRSPIKNADMREADIAEVVGCAAQNVNQGIMRAVRKLWRNTLPEQHNHLTIVNDYRTTKRAGARPSAKPKPKHVPLRNRQSAWLADAANRMGESK